MFRFFSKIRWRLAQDNQFFKYSRYAIGEIVLVVIGILIALQINNWNENQKKLKLEKEILLEISEGLKADLQSVNKVIDNHLIYIESQEIITNWIKQKRSFHDSIIPHFTHTFLESNFLPNDAQFESLKEFGIRNISNKELAKQVSHLYDYVYEDLLMWQSEYKNTSFNFRNSHDELGFEFIEDSTGLQLDIKPSDPKLVLDSKPYLFNLNVSKATLKIYTEHILMEARKEIEKTIIMIEEELNSV